MILAPILDGLQRVPAPKERAILDVALRLFSQQGYRGTSMEDIAHHAGLGKGTLYLYFESKEALFRDVCEYVCDYALAHVRDAALLDAPYAQRIAVALSAKFGFLYRVVATAPFGSELVDSRDTLAADIFKRLNRRVELTITALVERGILCGEFQRTSRRLGSRAIAQSLIAAMRGISSLARDGGDFDRRAEATIALFLEGLERS